MDENKTDVEAERKKVEARMRRFMGLVESFRAPLENGGELYELLEAELKDIWGTKAGSLKFWTQVSFSGKRIYYEPLVPIPNSDENLEAKHPSLIVTIEVTYSRDEIDENFVSTKAQEMDDMMGDYGFKPGSQNEAEEAIRRKFHLGLGPALDNHFRILRNLYGADI